MVNSTPVISVSTDNNNDDTLALKTTICPEPQLVSPPRSIVSSESDLEFCGSIPQPLGSSAEIVNRICKDHIKYSNLIANTRTLCIDGTSCTRKSSVLYKTFADVYKTQQLYRIPNPNSFFPSMLGYICTGLRSTFEGYSHFNDRSPLNVLEWHVLWRVINDFTHYFDNERPCEEKHGSRLQLYRDIFQTLRCCDFYKMFRVQINTIVFIDSDLNRCDALRQKRNEGSDRKRSFWKFYTPLQNLMYRTLYPDTYIDLAWFDIIPVNRVEHRQFNQITENELVKHLAGYCNEISDRLYASYEFDDVVVSKCRLPTVQHDYYHSNLTAHLYRTMGRLECRKIYKTYHPDVTTLEDPSTTTTTTTKTKPAQTTTTSIVKKLMKRKLEDHTINMLVDQQTNSDSVKNDMSDDVKIMILQSPTVKRRKLVTSAKHPTNDEILAAQSLLTLSAVIPTTGVTVLSATGETLIQHQKIDSNLFADDNDDAAAAVADNSLNTSLPSNIYKYFTTTD
jgi:hypothetical protein